MSVRTKGRSCGGRGCRQQSLPGSSLGSSVWDTPHASGSPRCLLAPYRGGLSKARHPACIFTSFIPKYFLISFAISFFIYWVIRNMMLISTFVSFSHCYQLLICNFDYCGQKIYFALFLSFINKICLGLFYGLVHGLSSECYRCTWEECIFYHFWVESSIDVY